VSDTDAPSPVYPPSWLDRFTQWVERLPGRSWMFYPALGLILAFISTAVNWADGTYPIGTFDARAENKNTCALSN
jgi:hypothetical protein